MDRVWAKLEDQVKRLTADTGKLQDQVVETRVALATLSERVAQLPSKGYINTVVVGALAIVAALITFQQNIQSFFHVGH